MSLYFIHLWKFLGKPKEPSAPSPFWKIYVMCNQNTLESAEIRQSLSKMSIEDKQNTLNRLEDLIKKSSAPNMKNGSFQSVYDQSDFHESFSHELKTGSGNMITVKVLRLRKSDIRIFLFYPKNIAKTAIILSALSKRQDKLSKKDEKYLKKLVDSTTQYWDITHDSYTEISTRLI